MKWPKSVTLIRHDESEYNVLKRVKKESILYQEFISEFDKNPTSKKTTQLALKLKDILHIGKGDHNTPLAPGAGHQATDMAKALKKQVDIPDIVFISPYERTTKTFEKMTLGWPELKKVRVVEEARIREQEHGLALLYNDRRIFQALHPEQRTLHELEGKYYYRFPQGESVEDVRERARSWFGALIRDFANKNVLAITHHLTILAVRANLERWDSAQFLEFDKNNEPINAGVTIYRGDPTQGSDGKLILDQYNTKLY